VIERPERPTYTVENLQRASFILFKTSKFYSAHLVNLLNFKSSFSRMSLEITFFKHLFSYIFFQGLLTTCDQNEPLLWIAISPKLDEITKIWFHITKCLVIQSPNVWLKNIILILRNCFLQKWLIYVNKVTHFDHRLYDCKIQK
jgi:hypothetical protein